MYRVTRSSYVAWRYRGLGHCSKNLDFVAHLMSGGGNNS